MMKTATKHKSRRFRRFLKVNEAVSALEYAILVGVIAGGIGAVIATMGGEIKEGIEAIGRGVDEKSDIAGSTF